MPRLTETTRRAIIDVITPFMGEGQRYAWITPIVDKRTHNIIEWHGASGEFTAKLVRLLEDRSIDGQPALYILLESMYSGVGLDIQHQLDILMQRLITKLPEESMEPEGAGRVKTPFQYLQTFTSAFISQWSAFMSDQKLIWTSNLQRMEVFHLSHIEPIASWILDNRPWKTITIPEDADRMILSDWYGNVIAYSIDPQSNRPIKQFLVEASYSSVPNHRFIGTGADKIVATAWDGQIIQFDMSSAEVINTTKQPSLVLILRTLRDGRIAYSNDHDEIILMDVDLKITWHLQCPAGIRDFWVVNRHDGEVDIFILTDDNQVLVSNSTKQSIDQTLQLPSVTDYSFIHQDGQSRLLLHYAPDQLQWLSWQPLVLLDESPLTLDAPITQITALSIKRESAIGLTKAGDIAYVYGGTCKVFRQKLPIEHIMVDEFKKFMFWLSEREIIAYALSDMVCSMELVETEGKLAINSVEALSVTLRNNGDLPVKAIKAQMICKDYDLIGRDHISEEDFYIPPGDTMTLRFNIQISQAGEIPIVLQLDLDSDIGIHNSLSLDFDVHVGRKYDT